MRHDHIITEIQNPDATKGLKLSVKLAKNTSDEDIEKNIRANSVNYTNWLQCVDEHDKPAILLGGGESINENIDVIKELQNKGATVFAMNAASKWAHENGIKVDYQVIIDAQEETSMHVDLTANKHLFASRCNPSTFEAAPNPLLFHMMELYMMEDMFPPERVKEGGYVLVGGDTSCGICALCVAFSIGHRWLHVFGYDSSYTEGKSHAYKQTMNEGMATMEVEHYGRKFVTSIAMSKQPASFMAFTRLLKDAGCSFNLYGDGLLQTIYNATANLTEKEKYETMWALADYRTMSPGELLVDFYLDTFKPDSRVIDFGCGTGRAAKAMVKRGIEVLLIDFTENSRDEDAMELPFMQCDLTDPTDFHGLWTPPIEKYGFCTDVMEHLPEKDVKKAIDNMMNAAKHVFFQISTVDDNCGMLIGQRLHLTVEPHEWWKEVFLKNGYKVEWEQKQEIAALFYITNPDRRNS